MPNEITHIYRQQWYTSTVCHCFYSGIRNVDDGLLSEVGEGARLHLL